MEEFYIGLRPFPALAQGRLIWLCGSRRCVARVPYSSGLCERQTSGNRGECIMLCQGFQRLSTILCRSVGSIVLLQASCRLDTKHITGFLTAIYSCDTIGGWGLGIFMRISSAPAAS